MKRKEFVDIINTVAQEERELMAKSISEAVANHNGDNEKLANVIAAGFMQATDSSVRSAAKIIERLGLLPLTDD